jgi:endoglucanase
MIGGSNRQPKRKVATVKVLPPWKQPVAMTAIAAFMVVGVFVIMRAGAAGSFVAAETETGTVAGPAQVISDSGASGGHAVQFGSGTTPTSGFTVSGNNILDSASHQVLLHGVDRPSLEWSCTGTTVNNAGGGIPATDFSTIRSTWNANAVRLAVDQDRWLPGAKDSCAGYATTVENAVKAIENNGMIAIIDLHWSDQGNLANSSGQQCMPDQNSITFWQQVAALYKNDPKVWFELYNEPYPPGSSQTAKWSLWQNGGSVTCTSLVGGHSATWNAPGMQAMANAVRGTGANNIIIAGGTDFSSQLGGVPHLTGGNIAYAIHIYRQSSTWSTSGWDFQFGTTAATVPIISTEFGDQVCDGQAFDQAFLTYVHAHNVGYTAWAWFVAGCNWTSIITDAAGDCGPTPQTGCAIQADSKKDP